MSYERMSKFAIMRQNRHLRAAVQNWAEIGAYVEATLPIQPTESEFEELKRRLEDLENRPYNPFNNVILGATRPQFILGDPTL